MTIAGLKNIYEPICSAVKNYNSRAGLTAADTEYLYQPLSPEIIQEVIQSLLAVPTTRQPRFSELAYDLALDLREGATPDENPENDAGSLKEYHVEFLDNGLRLYDGTCIQFDEITTPSQMAGLMDRLLKENKPTSVLKFIVSALKVRLQ